MARESFLVIRLGSLGDVIHGIPAVAALRQRYPDARIDWLVDPKYVELLELVEGLDAPVPFDPRGLVRGSASWRTLSRLRAARYDAVVDLQGLLKSAVIARLVGAARVVGFPREHLRERAAGLFYTETPDPGQEPHVIHKSLALVRALGVDASGVRFPWRTAQSALAAAVRAHFGPEGYTLINPGAAWPNKRWPTARFGAVAAAIRQEYGLRSLVMWGPGEEPLAAEVVAASEGSAEAAPPTTITDIVAITRGGRLMVSGDTGPLHIGGSLGVPLVALFGPTLPARNGPWDARDEVLSRVAECACFYQRQCRRAERCIDDIGVEEVLVSVRRRLGGHG